MTAPIVHTLPNARGVESLCIVLCGNNGVYSAAVFGAFAPAQCIVAY
jgi:hypothetical protein